MTFTTSQSISLTLYWFRLRSLWFDCIYLLWSWFWSVWSHCYHSALLNSPSWLLRRSLRLSRPKMGRSHMDSQILGTLFTTNQSHVPYGHSSMGLIRLAKPVDGCSTLQNEPSHNDTIIYILVRGGCDFTEKVPRPYR
jgi:hypothetical protein